MGPNTVKNKIKMEESWDDATKTDFASTFLFVNFS